MPSAFITYLLTKNKSCGDKLSALVYQGDKYFGVCLGGFSDVYLNLKKEDENGRKKSKEEILGGVDGGFYAAKPTAAWSFGSRVQRH